MAAKRIQSRLFRLCEKELKETIRDRRTIITLLLMPLMVYPLLSMGLNRLLISAVPAGGPTSSYRIGVATVEEAELLDSIFNNEASQPPQEILDASGGELASFEFGTIEGSSPEEELKANGIDLAARVSSDRPPRISFTAFRGDSASEACQRIMVERLQWLKMRHAQSVATQQVPQYTPPAEVTVQVIGEPQQASLLATIVPLVLVLMTITGAVYPAIDLTAGERERGTMESLMASPVPRFYVLFAKYSAVVTVALLTALANLLAMFATLWSSGLLSMLSGSDAFPWLAVLQILGLLVLFSSFFSALLLALTSFAKSFKEAQAYLIPVMLLSITPGMLSLMPGVKLSGPLAIAPLVNIVILARDVLSGTVDGPPAMAAILSTMAYAAAALAVAARLFGTDAVTRTSDQSIGSLFRRPEKPTDVPSPQTAALMLALLVPIYFVVSNSLIRIIESFSEDLSINSRLVLNAIALAFTFGLIPYLFAHMSRCRLKSTYRIWTPTIGSIVGALLVGCGAWVIAHEAFVFADAIGIGGLNEERIQQTLKTLDAFTKSNPILLVTALALTPAIIEELCFRGFLFSALGKILSPARVIVITSLIFGLFHVLTGNALLIERFVPTTLLGLILGWIAYRTGSVLPGILMHFVHNALLELVAFYHKDLEFLGEGFSDQTHLPPWMLATGFTVFAIGVATVWLSTLKKNNRKETETQSFETDAQSF